MTEIEYERDMIDELIDIVIRHIDSNCLKENMEIEIDNNDKLREDVLERILL